MLQESFDCTTLAACSPGLCASGSGAGSATEPGELAGICYNEMMGL